MGAYVDGRGPYVLELASNADARRIKLGHLSWPHYWADNLFVGGNGHQCFAKVGAHIIFFFPHEGEGEPRPQP